jgi:hypothetical protein
MAYIVTADRGQRHLENGALGGRQHERHCVAFSVIVDHKVQVPVEKLGINLISRADIHQAFG